MTCILLCWWGIGLLLAISGLRRGNLPSRIAGVLTIGAFLFYAWDMLRPVVMPTRRRAPWHNPAASGKGGMAALFHAERAWPALPEPQR